jgi:hypothetical protein
VLVAYGGKGVTALAVVDGETPSTQRLNGAFDIVGCQADFADAKDALLVERQI